MLVAIIWIISAMTYVSDALCRSEFAENAADEAPERLDGSDFGLSEDLLEFGEGHLDRVKIRGGRQERHPRTGPSDKAGGFAFMARQIVEDHDVSGAQDRNKDLFDVSDAIARDAMPDAAGRRRCDAAHGRARFF